MNDRPLRVVTLQQVENLSFRPLLDSARVKRAVGQGGQLIVTVKSLCNKRGLWKFSAVAKVDDQVAAEAEIMCTMRDK